MSQRALRRLWFAGLWLLFPWPLAVFADAFVPAARYALLGAVAAAVAIAEGGSGPVGMILVLFLGMAAATTAACFAIAWLVAKALARVPARTALRLTLAVLVVALALALALHPYRTPFGRAPTGGLLEILS